MKKIGITKVTEQNNTNKPPQEKVQSQSYWEMMIKGIVRPPRANYKNTQLGGNYLSCNGRHYFHEERKLLFRRKEIELTIYFAEEKNNFIILYMHGNSSCKVQSLGLMKHIPKSVSMASFDFMGCGKNQQEETITLGYRETEQAEFVTNYLRDLGFRVILWGRSMGAATALLYGDAEFIVADSSYKSFKSLCKQVAKQHSPTVLPNCLITCFFPCVFDQMRKDIDKRAKYDVEDLDVKEAMNKLNPNSIIIFMSGKSDKLIHPRNSQKLHNACPCTKKYFKLFEGDHNSRRPESTMIEVMAIIEEYIQNSLTKPISIPEIKLKINES